MSRGTSLNDDIYVEEDDTDDARIASLEKLIKATQDTVVPINTHTTSVKLEDDVVINIPGKVNLWRRFWLYFFFGFKTEVTKQ
jgi:hypothetical protein